MAKKAYIGVNNVAKKIDKCYIGVNNVARKIKKAYVGIGGVARPCWNSTDFYYGQVTPLSEGRMCMGATSLNGHALFAGGYNDATYRDIVDAYDEDLTRTSIEPLSVAAYCDAGITVGDYALFGGFGYTDYSDEVGGYFAPITTVNAYDKYFTRKPVSDLSYRRERMLAATSVGNYALFAGSPDSYYADVDLSNRVTDAYDSALTKTTCANLSVCRYNSAAVSISGYAIFAGGDLADDTSVIEGQTDVVDAYTSSLTMMLPDRLGAAVTYLCAGRVGGYALFTGGDEFYPKDSGYVTAQGRRYMEVYNSSLTRLAPVDLGGKVRNQIFAPLGRYAMFTGGDDGSYKLKHAMSVDTSLTIMQHSQSMNMSGKCATYVGDYALFAGGQQQGYVDGVLVTSYLDIVEAYTIQE